MKPDVPPDPIGIAFLRVQAVTPAPRATLQLVEQPGRSCTCFNSRYKLRDIFYGIQNVEVVEERYAHDALVWSSAGVAAGTDMTLAFIAAMAGEEAAGTVQIAAEYYPSCVDYGAFAKHSKAPGYIKRAI